WKPKPLPRKSRPGAKPKGMAPPRHPGPGPKPPGAPMGPLGPHAKAGEPERRTAEANRLPRTMVFKLFIETSSNFLFTSFDARQVQESYRSTSGFSRFSRIKKPQSCFGGEKDGP